MPVMLRANRAAIFISSIMLAVVAQTSAFSQISLGTSDTQEPRRIAELYTQVPNGHGPSASALEVEAWRIFTEYFEALRLSGQLHEDIYNLYLFPGNAPLNRARLAELESRWRLLGLEATIGRLEDSRELMVLDRMVDHEGRVWSVYASRLEQALTRLGPSLQGPVPETEDPDVDAQTSEPASAATTADKPTDTEAPSFLDGTLGWENSHSESPENRTLPQPRGRAVDQVNRLLKQ